MGAADAATAVACGAGSAADVAEDFVWSEVASGVTTATSCSFIATGAGVSIGSGSPSGASSATSCSFIAVGAGVSCGAAFTTSGPADKVGSASAIPLCGLGAGCVVASANTLAAGVVGARIISSSEARSTMPLRCTTVKTRAVVVGAMIVIAAKPPSESAVVRAFSTPSIMINIILPGAARPAIIVSPSASTRTSSMEGGVSGACSSVSALAFAGSGDLLAGALSATGASGTCAGTTGGGAVLLLI